MTKVQRHEIWHYVFLCGCFLFCFCRTISAPSDIFLYLFSAPAIASVPDAAGIADVPVVVGVSPPPSHARIDI
jgi:hypothetical protein